MVCLFGKMLYILVLCRALFAAGVQTLSIDSQLGTSIEDCFERISIGEQLPSSAIYRNVSELTTRECEQICKQDKQCQTYDYGVGAKGNASCELSSLHEKEIKEKNVLVRHPDYDVYVRRFQCEQSPPIPIQSTFNDPPDGPTHRPVFRPEVDEPKRPLSDYPDLRPFETGRPDIRPYPPYRPTKLPYGNHIDERPDDYTNPKPDFDRPPSYGIHKPQDIPFKPERPYPNHPNKKPDPYDVLQFQDQYGRPPRPYPGVWRPDPNYPPTPADDIPDIYGPKPQRPQRPSDLYIPEDKPQYLYVTRPNKKPKPQGDAEYNKPVLPPQGYPTRPDPYGQNDPYVGPIGPPQRPYKPSRPHNYPYKPYDRPSYNYEGQYASNYGQNQYHDNSIYLEIFDPPYRPSKPVNDRPSYGSYGPSYSYGNPGGYGGSQSHSSNAQSQSSSHYFGIGTITPLDDHNQHYNRPLQDPAGYRPQKPLHDSPSYGGTVQGQPSPSYGGPSSGYGSQSNKPSDIYKPSYGSQGDHGTQGSYNNQNQYGSSQSYGGSSQSSYGSSSLSAYGISQDQQTGYGVTSQPQGNYGINKPLNDKPSYNKPSHDDNRPSYGGNRPLYDDRPSYGTKPSYNDDRPSYGNQPSYNNERPSYGNKPSNDEKPSYGNKPSYNDERPSYGTKPSYNDERPSYGTKPSYNDERPSYNDERPSYGTKPSYNDERPSYGNKPTNDEKPSYGNKPSYNDERPSYGNKPSYNDDKPSYSNKPYNDDRPSYGTKPSYDNDRPDGDLGPFDDGPSYGSRPSRPYESTQHYQSSATPGYGVQVEDNKNTGYGNQKPKPNQTGYGRPDVKPVYEFEMDKPGDVPSYIVRPSGEVITSRPVTIGDFNRPGYGRDPGQEVSYKACFRRVLAGRRALRSHVRKVAPCERLEDCRRECATERRFHCESFNYRLDTSFRGKGLCELMTKPIEAFDIRRDFVDDKDYDFYELDRNSLEPHCPETLRGPGLLHSGYLTSKPSPEEYSWRDRNEWFDRDESRYRYRDYDRRGDMNFGRRYEDQLFVPYQIGIGRSNDEQENWGQYGGYYGGDYGGYKDRNDYHKSISHWGLNDIQPHYGVKPQYGARPHENPNFNYNDLGRKGWRQGYGYGAWKRGRWNSSGLDNGLDYGESSYYKPPKIYYESDDGRNEDVIVKDCSSRRRPGMSLGSGAIRRSLIALNVVECEAACFNEREFKCVSYSYRYSSSRGTDNCFLSERPYRGLELSADSGSDVYAMPLHQGCTTINQKPWVESECFWHVRSGAAVGGAAARAALTVAGLGACEAECIRAHAFFCRGFSFRYDSPVIGDDLENCILTSSPPTSLENGRGLRPSGGHELYSRGNYGRGCEPALYDDVHHRETGECYLQYDNAAKLIGPAVRGQARVRDEQACGNACTDAPFRCLSFSYNNNAPPGLDNCLMSEVRLFDLQRGVDYEHSANDWLFAFDLFNGQCWRKVHGRGEYESPTPELPRPIVPPPHEDPYTGSGPSGPPGYLPAPPEHSYIPASGPPSGPGYNHPPAKPGYPGPGYLVPPEPRPYPPKPYPEPSGPGYKPGYLPEPPIVKPGYPGYLPEPGPGFKPNYPVGPSYGPGYRPDRPDPGYPGEPGRPYPGRPAPERPIYPGDREEEPIAVSWRHYTVSGFPCRKGTTCAQNQVAGHWACEPEGGEVGSWDYCCAPTHRCGYSEGFHKPWCYVGPSQDQWRPCSEKYYPYHQHNIPHPSQGHRGDGRPSRPYPNKPYLPEDSDRPQRPYISEADRKYWDDLYKNGPQAYYDKYGNPLPGYSRVPTADRPYIKYHHNYPRPGSGQWVPVSGVSGPGELEPPVPGGLGVPRYWPVAYLHKGPPPNITYFRYNETDRTTTTTERYNPPPPDTPPRDRPPSPFSRVNPDRPNGNNIENKNHRDEKTRNITNVNEDVFNLDLDKVKTTTTTQKPEIKQAVTEAIVDKDVKVNESQIVTVKPETLKADKEMGSLKGIDGKIDDFSSSIEVLDIEDVKGEKVSHLKTLEAEERQIEAIGRLLASRRGGKLILEKRSQKELESKSIAVDKDVIDYNFGNKFPTTERRGIIQKVTKEQLEKERNMDRSLEVSETTFVRPPRILSTTENIRKAIINGKVFYDATIREQRDIYSNSTRKPKSLRPLEDSNSTRKPKSLRPLEDSRAPSIFQNSSYGKKKIVRPRNVNPVNPVRKVRRVYRRKYNPEEVRRRLLERERNMKKEMDDNRKL